MNQQLADVRANLVRARDEVLRRRGDLREEEGELLGVREPDHVDAGTAEGGAIPLDSLNESERGRIEEIEAALHRIDRGEYAICTSCSESIEPRRLEAIPWAERCFPCETEFEKEHRGVSTSGMVPPT